MQEVYHAVDERVLGLRSHIGDGAGSCAVTAVVVGDCLLVANVGDCEAWLCKGGEAVEMTY